MFSSKHVIRESHAICTYELRHSLDLSLLKKRPVFLQNASGNPSTAQFFRVCFSNSDETFSMLLANTTTDLKCRNVFELS